MTCYYPNNAHVTGTRDTGTKIIKFGLPKKSDHESFLLPCGQCLGCRLDYSQMWAVRSMHEAQQNEDNCFITLTYSEENLPHDGSLIPNHQGNLLKDSVGKSDQYGISFVESTVRLLATGLIITHYCSDKTSLTEKYSTKTKEYLHTLQNYWLQYGEKASLPSQTLPSRLLPTSLVIRLRK